MSESSLSTAFLLFLLALIFSVMLVVSLAEWLEPRPDPSARLRCLLALTAHVSLAVIFLELTSGQAVARIGWVHESMLFLACVAVVTCPGWRRLVERAKLIGF